MYAVMTENDESQWSDDTGVIYHFPKRYKAILQPETRVIYYTGKMRKATYAAKRLSPDPHYFGVAIVGSVHPDRESDKGDLFATIEGFERFRIAVPAKTPAGSYIERIPPNRAANYWRDGVRQVERDVFGMILHAAGLDIDQVREPMPEYGEADYGELESGVEGRPAMRYVTTYERNPKLRRQALAIHGYRCLGCDLEMSERYGPYAKGLIHVHHVQPVSTYEAPKTIDPSVDLVPLCPNCHAVIHRHKVRTLSVAEVRAMVMQGTDSRALLQRTECTHP